MLVEYGWKPQCVERTQKTPESTNLGLQRKKVIKGWKLMENFLSLIYQKFQIKGANKPFSV